jgi:hypothetical protein
LPEGLKNAILEGKQIIVFMNPPYGKATPNKGNDGTGISTTMVNVIMNQNKQGIASSQLYTQFLYKLNVIKNDCNSHMHICSFLKPNFLSSEGFREFRKFYLNKLNYKKGMIFQASNFDDVSDSWGINFTIWKNEDCLEKNNFIHDAKIVNNFVVETISEKNIYNVDDKITSQKWFNDKVKNDMFLPPIKSALQIDRDKDKLGYSKAVGYFNNHSNNVMQHKVIFFASSVISSNANKPITLNNFNKSCALFTSRKIIHPNWLNDKDEYMAPNEEHPQYKQFNNDAIVYSLFNTSSNQSSMRQITYKDKLWDIKNEFFFMSKEELKVLAEQYHFDELYKDVRGSEDRYVFNVLKDTPLSQDALEVLEMGKGLVRKSFEMRKVMHDEHPEYHLHAWDAGWYQIKKILNEYYKEDLKKFTEKYKALEDRLRPMVYELGFLKS